MYTERGPSGQRPPTLGHAGPCQCPHCLARQPSCVPGGGGRPADRSAPPRQPRRRPVFLPPDPCGPPDAGSRVWEPGPAPWHYYTPVRDRCACVAWADAGTPQPPPPQFRGQARHRSLRYAEDEEEERCWECAAAGHYHSPLGPAPTRPHAPNGHGALCAEGGGHGDNHRAWSRRRGVSEGRDARSVSREALFSTEVPARSQLRRKGAHVVPLAEPPGQEPALGPDGQQNHQNHQNLQNHQHQQNHQNHHQNHQNHQNHRQLQLQQHQPPDPARQKGRRQDSVRDQIRQVVSDLEGVLGGLKQVHVEMREVVDHIDRLTANIDLSEQQPSIGQTGSGGPPHQAGLGPPPHQAGHGVTPHRGLSPHQAGHGVPPHHGLSPHQAGLGVTPHHGLSPHQAGPSVPPHHGGPPQAPSHLHRDEDHVVLRTNAPSPVHTASVVKTRRVPLPKESHRDRRGMNGHAPPPRPARDHEAAPPRSLDPTVVVVANGREPRTHKPPRCPPNGRCGPGQPPGPLKGPAAYPPGRGRQSTSMV